MTIFIFLIIVLFAFALFGPSASKISSKSSAKDEIQKYLSEFNMYLCIENKTLFYPPKEICINDKYHTLNLHTKSKLLAHKNISGNKLTPESLKCTECLLRCPVSLSSGIADLGLSFAHFREISDEELKTYLNERLTPKQFELLFEKPDLVCNEE